MGTQKGTIIWPTTHMPHMPHPLLYYSSLHFIFPLSQYHPNIYPVTPIIPVVSIFFSIIPNIPPIMPGVLSLRGHFALLLAALLSNTSDMWGLGVPFGAPNNEDWSILGSILGFPSKTYHVRIIRTTLEVPHRGLDEGQDQKPSQSSNHSTMFCNSCSFYSIPLTN